MSSNTKLQQWFSELSPKTAASRRLVEFCKQDIKQQSQQDDFDSRVYCESVLYLLRHLEQPPRADIESEQANQNVTRIVSSDTAESPGVAGASETMVSKVVQAVNEQPQRPEANIDGLPEVSTPETNGLPQVDIGTGSASSQSLGLQQQKIEATV